LHLATRSKHNAAITHKQQVSRAGDHFKGQKKMAETSVEANSRLLQAAHELRTFRQSVITAMERYDSARSVISALSCQRNRAEARTREAERNLKLLHLSCSILRAELETLAMVAHDEYKVWAQRMENLWSAAFSQSDDKVVAAAHDYQLKTSTFATVQQLRETYTAALTAASTAVFNAKEEVELAGREQKKLEIAQLEAEAFCRTEQGAVGSLLHELQKHQRQLTAAACVEASMPEPWYALVAFEQHSLRYRAPEWRSLTHPLESMINMPKPRSWQIAQVTATDRAPISADKNKMQQDEGSPKRKSFL
jgi:hypothetical protein